MINGENEKHLLKNSIQLSRYKKIYEEDLEQKYEKIASWRHDYKNNMNTMLNLANDENKEKLYKYIEDFCDEIEKIESIVFTNCNIIDYVVTAKYYEAKRIGIHVKMKCGKVNQGSVSDFDLNTILSNLLDNAIEATENTKNKYVNIVIYERKNNIVIIVKNTFNGIINYSNGKYSSIKVGSNHGVGLHRVNNALQKYNGFMIMKNNDNIFENKVIIPNIKLNKDD